MSGEQPDARAAFVDRVAKLATAALDGRWPAVFDLLIENRGKEFIGETDCIKAIYGPAGVMTLWKIELSEPIRVGTFATMLAFFNENNVSAGISPLEIANVLYEILEDRPGHYLCDGEALKSARTSGIAGIFDLSIDGRAVAEWLISKPKRKHLVPGSLNTLLTRGVELDLPNAVQTPSSVPVKRPRGPRPTKQGAVIGEMITNVRTGKISLATLQSDTEETLASIYKVSRDTARKARNTACAELVAISNSDN